MIKAIREYLRRRQFDRAVAVLKKHGLVAARVKRVAGTDYIETAEGSLRKIGRGE